jgi:hypothetical protein
MSHFEVLSVIIFVGGMNVGRKYRENIPAVASSSTTINAHGWSWRADSVVFTKKEGQSPACDETRKRNGKGGNSTK